jgi:hypothetical protein
VLAAAALHELTWSSLFDDGPFHGKPVREFPTTTALQKFPLREFTLEVYAPSSANVAPVVLLRKPDKSVLWAIHAEGVEKTSVESIEFVDYRTRFDITVHARVKWTYGNEIATWVIGRDGSLKEYWYSW